LRQSREQAAREDFAAHMAAANHIVPKSGDEPDDEAGGEISRAVRHP
jgi:hypothetical protein